MTSKANEYPKQKLVWRGAILGSIAHAVAVARYPILAHEQSWDDNNYCVQDSAGSRATVSFSGKMCVAVFFSENSDRNPFISDDVYDLQRFLSGLPNGLVTLAREQALQYVLQNYNGIPSPIITSAFWGDGKHDRVAAAEPWTGVFENGAFLIKNQLLTLHESIAAWKEDYEFSDDEIAVVSSIFQRRVSEPILRMSLTAAERSLMESIADEEGFEACRESFAEINISV